MKMRRAIVGLLLLAAVLLAGCGDNASADRKAMDRRFEQIDFKISSLETITSTYNQPHFEQETDRYIALVRRYADLLGPAEAKKRLNQKGDELSSFCLPCAGRLTDEAAKY